MLTLVLYFVHVVMVCESRGRLCRACPSVATCLCMRDFDSNYLNLFSVGVLVCIHRMYPASPAIVLVYFCVLFFCIAVNGVGAANGR